MITNIKIKVKWIACAALLTINYPLFIGCSDFLEIPSRSEIVLEEFWNEKSDVDNIVAGCYSRMQGDDVLQRFIVWGEGRADNVKAGNRIDQDANLENVLKENITTKNPYTGWDGFYNVINRCNTVIKYAPGVAAIDPGYTEGELRATIAEVSALRDLMYFYLIRTFRDVPYYTYAFTDDDQPMDLVPTPFEAVLDSLIADLEYQQNNAMKRYAYSESEFITAEYYQTGRITKCAIWAMLCEMYLWKKDYDNCIKYADLVVEDKKDLLKERRNSFDSYSFGSNSDVRTNGFPLSTGSSSNSTYGGFYDDIFVEGNSQETIFELLFSPTNHFEAGRSMPSNSGAGRLYGYGEGAQIVCFLAPSSIVTGDASRTNGRTVYANENYYADSRMYINFSSADETIRKFVAKGCVVSSGATHTSKPTYGWTNSADDQVSNPYYTHAKTNDVDYYYNSSSWIIYRLSDILLLKAEALCQKLREGSDQDIVAYNTPYLDQAFNLVNAVNKRAVAQPVSALTDTLVRSTYNTKAQMEELVLKERQRELMFEGKRWYDLVRRSMRDGNTDVLCEAMANRESTNASYVNNFFGNSGTGMWAIFWPYNDEETKVSTNLATHQNPAFSSGESNISK